MDIKDKIRKYVIEYIYDVFPKLVAAYDMKQLYYALKIVEELKIENKDYDHLPELSD